MGEWYFDERTGTYVVPGGGLSLAVLEDGRAHAHVLRIELLSRDIVPHPISWGELDMLYRDDPLSAIARIALMAKEGTVPTESSNVEVQRSISNRSDAV